MGGKDKLILATILNYIVSCIFYIFAVFRILPGIFASINSIEAWLWILFIGLVLITGIIWTRFYIKFRQIDKSELN
jgi:hypothetical protein